MSPWKTEPGDKLPAAEVLAKLAATKPGEPAPVQLTPRQQQTHTGVSQVSGRKVMTPRTTRSST